MHLRYGLLKVLVELAIRHLQCLEFLSKAANERFTSPINTSIDFSLTNTDPCGCSVSTGIILLIAAVVGFGETGKRRSPINALAKEDLPALKAPKRATVND